MQNDMGMNVEECVEKPSLARDGNRVGEDEQECRQRGRYIFLHEE